SRLFQMWDGFWVAPIAESDKVKPGGWLNLYLLALNLRDKEQRRTLRASDSPVAEGMKGNLSFSLPPRSWAVQLVSVPATQPSASHALSRRQDLAGQAPGAGEPLLSVARRIPIRLARVPWRRDGVPRRMSRGTDKEKNHRRGLNSGRP